MYFSCLQKEKKRNFLCFRLQVSFQHHKYLPDVGRSLLEDPSPAHAEFLREGRCPLYDTTPHRREHAAPIMGLPRSQEQTIRPAAAAVVPAPLQRGLRRRVVQLHLTLGEDVALFGDVEWQTWP